MKYYTTIDNPDAARIHNIGLEEVKRIRAEMEKTLEGINFLGTLDQFLSFIRNDPRFYYKTPGRAVRGVRENRARHRAAVAEAVRPPAEGARSASARFPRPARRRPRRRITSRRRSTARGRATTT